MNNWHTKNIEQVFNEFFSKREGLNKKQVEENIKKYGSNKISEGDSRHPFFIFLKQFNNGLIYVLISAAVIAGLFGKWIDVYVIIAIVIVNAVIGFIQEYKAEQAINALKKMVVPMAKVYREGKLLKIFAEEIVPGDVVFLEEGDRVPADVRLFDVREIRTNESSLTGESMPVRKDEEVLQKNIELGDKKNMAWMGTFISGGRGKGVVVATGSSTVFGGIAEDIGGIKKEKGHFEEKVSILTRRMAIFSFTGAGLIFLISVVKNGASFKNGFSDFEEPLFGSIAALVSGIPEGLPAILAVVLAVGATRMAKRSAIIRHLPVTETLGVVDHIITDKTGTITQNTMTVREISLPNSDKIMVSGEGWTPEGSFYRDEQVILPQEENDLDKLLHIAEICNQAEITRSDDGKDNYEIIGDPTEGAMLVLAEKAGLKKEVVESSEKKIDDMPFSSKLKLRASLLKIGDKKEIYVTGSPEEVVKRAIKIRENGEVKEFTEEKKKQIIAEIEEMSEKAMRTIGLAYKEVEDNFNMINEDMLDSLVFSGAVGMIDPPRLQVKEAVEKANLAGIRVVMATGDHKKTAVAIAKEVNILKQKKENYPDALEQSELVKMSDEELEDAVKNVNVFARLTPRMKLRIATTLQQQGAIIAMTGDGVNDAPAVKQADVGIAMGIMGTDVTKEVGDIVLADDNFSSIVSAIEEGRVVFENTRKSSAFLITTNFGEIGTIILFLLLGFPLPLLPTQILWLNLVTDGLPALSLAVEPKHEDVLRKPPRNKKETILTKEILPFFIMMVGIMFVLSIIVFDMFYDNGEGLNKARTAVFSVLAFTQLYNAINMRSMTRSIFKIGFLSNKYVIISLFIGTLLQLAVIITPKVRDVFHFVPLSFQEILFIIIISSSVLWAGEGYKYIKYAKKH
ncbi:MAG: HAD-IC family P-type ATPase [Candidatus Pacebacteria bacterium]|nr:HAD-IC family P-type ATPase [Candidatus Paceibacterota bacterium]